MSTFLERILETKAQEVQALERASRDMTGVDLSQLPNSRGFADGIRKSSNFAVVAEIKKASPSKGLIAKDFRPAKTAQTYASAGAAAISVLTDETYFQGSLEVLRAVRAVVETPILRKDFIIDELQVLEARIAGADAVLLICAALAPSRLRALSAYAKHLGMDVLIEVHGLAELDAALAAEPSVLGVNNRDLHTFEVSLDTTRQVLRETPAGLVVIAESGVHTRQDAMEMAACGAYGVLVGESLMRQDSPEEVARLLQSFQVPRQVRVGNA